MREMSNSTVAWYGGLKDAQQWQTPDPIEQNISVDLAGQLTKGSQSVQKAKGNQVEVTAQRSDKI